MKPQFRLKLELIHAPGETDDQIVIWLPQKKVLLPADNFYKSFPNLYAIRGTAYRDVPRWINSLDNMRMLKPEYLVPSHTRPVVGAKKIYEKRRWILKFVKFLALFKNIPSKSQVE